MYFNLPTFKLHCIKYFSVNSLRLNDLLPTHQPSSYYYPNLTISFSILISNWFPCYYFWLLALDTINSCSVWCKGVKNVNYTWSLRHTPHDLVSSLMLTQTTILVHGLKVLSLSNLTYHKFSPLSSLDFFDHAVLSNSSIPGKFLCNILNF
jgi:hypothetical protein